MDISSEELDAGEFIRLASGHLAIGHRAIGLSGYRGAIGLSEVRGNMRPSASCGRFPWPSSLSLPWRSLRLHRTRRCPLVPRSAFNSSTEHARKAGSFL